MPCRFSPAASGAVGKFAGAHPLEQVEILLDERSRYGLSLPGSVNVPRYSRISSAFRSQTYALPSLDELHRKLIELLEIVGSISKPVAPIEPRASARPP